jgi:hypothetical protein
MRLSKAHPECGCGRLSKELRREGVHVSSPTIQRILIHSGMGILSDRIANTERLALSSPAT